MSRVETVLATIGLSVALVTSVACCVMANGTQAIDTQAQGVIDSIAAQQEQSATMAATTAAATSDDDLAAAADVAAQVARLQNDYVTAVSAGDYDAIDTTSGSLREVMSDTGDATPWFAARLEDGVTATWVASPKGELNDDGSWTFAWLCETDDDTVLAYATGDIANGRVSDVSKSVTKDAMSLMSSDSVPQP